MTVTFPRAMQRLAPVGGHLVGRDEEVAVLRHAWAEAAAGRAGMVLLAGEPGVGKTRLVAELAGEVDTAGGCVLVGACPARGAAPYEALVDALGPLPTGERDRAAMFDVLAAGVAARARRAPVLLVLDDMHNADRSTLLAVRRILDVAAAAPVLIVGTYRDTALDRSQPLAEFLTVVLPRPGVERVAVEGLPTASVAEMVGNTELGRRLWRHSSGNPVWVAELLRPGALDGSITMTFDQVVARRVARLGAPARALVEAAAVAGSQFGVDAAASAGRVPAGKVPAALKQLVAAGFVVDEPGGPADARRFVHEMVRDAVEGGIAPAARVQLHLRMAKALERRNGVPSALVAWHFRAAAPVGGSRRALHHSAEAGDLAMELLAWDEAAVHYGHALAAGAGAAPEVRADLLLALGEAQRLAGETARARQAFLEAATMARLCSDGSRMARAALALGHVDAVWGSDPELEAVAGEARTLLGEPRSTTRTLAAASFFASESLYDVLDGVAQIEEADPAPVAVKPDNADVALLRARHGALAGPDHTAERLQTAAEAVALAQRVGDQDLAVTAYGWRLLDALELGRMEQAVADQEAHAGAARRLDAPRALADAATWRAMRALLEGRVEEARSATTDAFDHAVEANAPEAEPSLLAQRWWLALEWGPSTELAEIAEECRARATAADGRMWRAALALVWARLGHLDLAAEELRRVTDHGLGELVRDPGRLSPLVCLTEVAWLLGDSYRAATVGALLEPYADRIAVAGRGLVCQGSVARACGMVAASAQRWDDAERHYRTAVRVHRALGGRPLLARTRAEWASMLDERGRKTDRRRAADSRKKASELAAGLGMARLLEEISGP